MALATCMCFNSCMQKRGQLKGWCRGETGMRLMLYLHNSVIQGLIAHSSNNPSVLYQTPHCGVDVNSTSHCSLTSNSWGLSLLHLNLKNYDVNPWHKTEVHWAILHVQYYCNSLGFKHCNAVHAYKPESQRVPQEYRQLILRIEKKLPSSHDCQKARQWTERRDWCNSTRAEGWTYTLYIVRNLFTVNCEYFIR